MEQRSEVKCDEMKWAGRATSKGRHGSQQSCTSASWRGSFVAGPGPGRRTSQPWPAASDVPPHVRQHHEQRTMRSCNNSLHTLFIDSAFLTKSASPNSSIASSFHHPFHLSLSAPPKPRHQSPSPAHESRRRTEHPGVATYLPDLTVPHTPSRPHRRTRPR